MKISVEVECTPLEARAFLGLPDVQPMQEKLMAEMQERLTANIRAMDPSEMMRLWFAPGPEEPRRGLRGLRPDERDET